MSCSTFVKVARACGKDGLGERWGGCQVSPTLNVFDNSGDARAVVLVYENHAQDCRVREIRGGCCVTIGSSEANSPGSTGNNPMVLTKWR